MNFITKLTFSLQLLLFIISSLEAQHRYEPNWDSLDKRPLPQWYDDAKIGIFLHWGVFSVPSFHSEWFWNEWISDPEENEVKDFMKRNYPPNFTYQDFAKDFTAEFFNATEWAEIFANSGAKYVVLTSKHHEGYALWPSKYSYSWNAQDVGPNRDLLGELAKAVRAKNITFGLYHSLYEWYNPIYLSDNATNWTKTEFVDNKIIPEMHELVEKYLPAVIWSDGDWEALDIYWKSTEFLAWLYNDSPVKDVVVVNDRWGIGIPCKHGDFYSCKDRYNPGILISHKWENAMTIDKKSWGFRRNAKLEDYFTTLELLTEIASTVSCGGNILINIGPTKDGIISPIFQDRLRDVGKWLSINGEAIYFSKPWTAQNDTLNNSVWYTSKKNVIYVITLFWPNYNTLTLGSVVEIFKNPSMVVSLLGNDEFGPLTWTLGSSSVDINFPDKGIVQSEWAYVLKIQPESEEDPICELQ